MTLPTTLLTDDDCYRALKTRDARFDGCFFTGVTSTGIYCRPVCGVKTPRRDNCRFFVHAAQAEQAGFRPCLRCRPELAPHALPWSVQDACVNPTRQAEQASLAWKPWRSYAVIRAWSGLRPGSPEDPDSTGLEAMRDTQGDHHEI